jgi:nucleoid-associated protein YgaU
MSNKSKAAVAVVIVAGILGLIIFDKAASPGASRNSPAAERPAEELSTIRIGNTPPPPERPPVVEETRPAEPPLDDYLVQPGETIFTIALQRYGSAAEARRILEANPGMDPGKLGAGTKLKLPPRTTQPVESRSAESRVEEKTVHTVQPGESLGMISTHYYKTARHAAAILEANKNLVPSPDLLRAGIKIVIPRIQEPAPAAAPTQARGRVHKVQAKDSLWKIAAQYDSAHINEMIDKIVKANAGKLESASTHLHVGWELVIPE